MQIPRSCEFLNCAMPVVTLRFRRFARWYFAIYSSLPFDNVISFLSLVFSIDQIKHYRLFVKFSSYLYAGSDASLHYPWLDAIKHYMNLSLACGNHVSHYFSWFMVGKNANRIIKNVKNIKNGVFFTYLAVDYVLKFL